MVRRAMRVSWMAAFLVLGIAAFGSAAALAGPYSRLQVLLPGESAAPGTTTGKTGTPNRQTANVPFTVTVRACDSGWNLVPTTTNAVLSEIHRTWNRPEAAELAKLYATVAPNYAALIESYMKAQDVIKQQKK